MKNLLKTIYQVLIFSGVSLASASLGEAQDITNLGGDLTSDNSPLIVLELPAPNIASEEKRLEHLNSHSDFHGSFLSSRRNGKFVLGPTFNHTSCGGCHLKNGKGAIKFSKTLPGSPMLVKVSLKGFNRDGSPKDIPGIGEQLQDQTRSGRSKFKISLTWRAKAGSYPDGTRYKLREPILRFSVPGINQKNILHSLRMTPSNIGMGLLEAVPDETLIAASDPNDRNSDGISGRVSYVQDKERNKKAIGRFGFRATHPTLKQQTAAAFFFDMGMTSALFQKRGTQQEVSAERLARVVFYLQLAGVTPAREQDNPDVVAGKALFQQLNCHGCHTMSLTTGSSVAHPELADQEFHPFTDLLLHDMGSGLADTRAEFSARKREWRTTPLWGIGLAGSLSKNKPGFLHDGRARTIEEAILWHGGEASRSRAAFKALQKSEREQLLRFLGSL